MVSSETEMHLSQHIDCHITRRKTEDYNLCNLNQLFVSCSRLPKKYKMINLGQSKVSLTKTISRSRSWGTHPNFKKSGQMELRIGQVFLILSLSVSTLCTSEEHTSPHPHLQTSSKCVETNGSGQWSEEHTGTLQQCLAKLDLQSYTQVPEDKKACFGKCVLINKGLIDQQGHVHKDKMAELLTTTVTDETTRKELQDKLEKCVDEHGPKVEPGDSDEHCTSYGQMVECMHETFIETCKA